MQKSPRGREEVGCRERGFSTAHPNFPVVGTSGILLRLTVPDRSTTPTTNFSFLRHIMPAREGVLALLIFLVVAPAALVSGRRTHGLPLSPVGAAKHHYFAPEPEQAPSAGRAANKAPPVWPFQWNATQAKINPFNSHIWWTKFYYDWPNGWTRYPSSLPSIAVLHTDVLCIR